MSQEANSADVRAAFDNIRIVIWDTCKQGKDCKGVCHRFEQNPPVGQKKYLNHRYCSRCSIWMNKNVVRKNGRCRCCNFRVRHK